MSFCFLALCVVAAFIAAVLSRGEFKENEKGKIAFSLLMALVSGTLFLVSGIISLILFCYEKLSQKHSVILLDKTGHAEYVHGADVAYYEE